MFTREMASFPLKTKKTTEVNEAFRKTVRELVGDETNYVVTTVQRNEFARLDDVLPEDAVHRQKTPSDTNAIAVVDQAIQTIKKDLASAVPNKSGDWSVHSAKIVNSYNNKSHDAVHGPPAQIET